MKKVIKEVLFKITGNTTLYKLWRTNKKKKQNQRFLTTLKEREKRKWQNKAIPAIEVVNLNANDICNSKCVMCNIWEQKKGFEISPDELGKILGDPLYKNVKHVGVTGGEPTLREDLPLLYEAIIKAIPGISGLSTITNCIKEQDVIARIEKVNEVCVRHGKEFSMMVSLDGYGDMHDRVRGRKGNFESAVNVINHFTKKGISVSTGSTISKVNVWEVDVLLDYLRENNIYGRFRVAEFIKRLYNDNKIEAIRNFDEDETYHLILFFYKLIISFETNDTFKRTYKSIINVLAGGKRLIGCPYQANGVVLNSKGELAYCAPKSNIIGNALTESALNLYNNNLGERGRIKESNCDNCIHDYHAPITYDERLAELEEEYWLKFIKIDSQIKFSRHKLVKPIKEGRFQVFITGWYGTETVGDKAILAGIVDEIYEQYGTDVNLVVTSIFPLITIKTLKELNITAKVIPVYSSAFVAYAKGSDIVIMGGGPLMDLEVLSLPLISFKLAKAAGKKTIIYGCGLGPLTFERYISAVTQILHLADEIKLRDKKSVEQAKKWLGKDISIELSGDPAKRYLAKYCKTQFKGDKRNVLTCFLREWTHEYSRNLSLEEFGKLKDDFELSLSIFIKQKAEDMGCEQILFEHMHNFVIGNDDRDFSRYFIKKYFSSYDKVKVGYNQKLSTVDSIVQAMQNSRHNISMRFHSVVFAHTLGSSFSAIDYTRGGKIANYLSDNNMGEALISVEDLVLKHKP